MPSNVDDFLHRFGSQQTMDDREAAHFMDRFASDRPEDRDFDNEAMSSGTTEYLGKLPESHFQEAAKNAYASVPPAQQEGLVGSLMRALQNRGVNPGNLFGSQDQSVPRQLTPDQYAQAANMARQQYPEVMQDVVKEQPWFVKAMGNPILMGALGMVASRMVRNRTRTDSNQPQSGGLLKKLF